MSAHDYGSTPPQSNSLPPLPSRRTASGSPVDLERTRQFQVVLRKAIQKRTAPELEEAVEESEPADDTISRQIALVFAPYQSDPLMMQIAERAEQFLRSRHRSASAMEAGS